MPLRRKSHLPARQSRQRLFRPARRPRHPAEPNGRHVLLAGDPTVRSSDFNADGTLNYIQDTNGNRITAGYTGGRLTSLTRLLGPVAGDRATMPPGWIDRWPAPRADASTYTYDTAEPSDHGAGLRRPPDPVLLQIRLNAAIQNALTSITSPTARTSTSPTTPGRLARHVETAVPSHHVRLRRGRGDRDRRRRATATPVLLRTGAACWSRPSIRWETSTFNTYDANFNLTSATKPDRP